VQEESSREIEPTVDTATLWDRLNSIDPQRASMIHPHDVYRLQRALSIWHATGKKPSDYVPVYNPPSSYDVYCLTRERHELYDRIDARVHIMMREGWIDEAKGLLGTPWEDFLRSKKIIGYPDIFDYISGDLSHESMLMMIHAIQQKTRNYAKRQMTFWRKLEKDLTRAQQMHEKNNLPASEITAINLTLLGVDLYINQLLKKVDVWFA
jgi:tRNA dimethylallyltransferase